MNETRQSRTNERDGATFQFLKFTYFSYAADRRRVYLFIRCFFSSSIEFLCLCIRSPRSHSLTHTSACQTNTSPSPSQSSLHIRFTSWQQDDTHLQTTLNGGNWMRFLVRRNRFTTKRRWMSADLWLCHRRSDSSQFRLHSQWINCTRARTRCRTRAKRRNENFIFIK